VVPVDAEEQPKPKKTTKKEKAEDATEEPVKPKKKSSKKDTKKEDEVPSEPKKELELEP